MAEGLLDITPPLPPRALASRRTPLPFPYDQSACRRYDFGRHALWHGLEQLGLGEGDELLTPAYHCGTEVGVLVDRGIVPRFWEGTEALEPDPEELEGMIGPRTRGLYLIHYLGLAQDGPRWRRWCDERGLLLLEDAAPSWLAGFGGEPVGSWGELAIFSPWKLTGVPEAGALLCEPPPEPLPLSSRLPLVPALKGFARWPVQRSRRAAAAMAKRAEPPFDAASEYAVGDPSLGMSKLSLELLRRIYRPDLPEIRRHHYEWLRERVGERVPVPFDRELAEDCPLYLPVTSADKAGLRAHLLDRGIRSVDFWSVPHPVSPPGAFPAIDRRRETTVLLPIHQELRRRELERIAAAVDAWPADAG